MVNLIKEELKSFSRRLCVVVINLFSTFTSFEVI